MVLRALALPIEVTCPAAPDNLSSGVCSPPVESGERVLAFGAGKFGGGAGLSSWDQGSQFLRGSLQQAAASTGGKAEVRVGAVGCAVGQDADCRQFAVLLVVRHQDGDQILQFAFRKSGSEVGFFGIVNQVPFAAELRSGAPYPATFGITPDWFPVSSVSFVRWTPN